MTNRLTPLRKMESKCSHLSKMSMTKRTKMDKTLMMEMAVFKKKAATQIDKITIQASYKRLEARNALINFVILRKSTKK